MKQHTTNYQNTFIAVASDCPVTRAEIPQGKEKKTVAVWQYELLSERPYGMTSDELLFTIHTLRHHLPETNWEEERRAFFGKSQACLRSSPLAKRYGWGFHHDQHGRVALYSVESETYQRLVSDKKLQQTRAMRTKK